MDSVEADCPPRERERPSFRADQSRNPISLPYEAAVVLDSLLNLDGEKEAHVNYSRRTLAPAGPGGLPTAAQRIRDAEAGSAMVRRCLDPRVRGISAMVESADYVHTAFPGQLLHD